MFGEKLIGKNKVGQTLRKHVFNKTFGIRHGNRIKSLNGIQLDRSSRPSFMFDGEFFLKKNCLSLNSRINICFRSRSSDAGDNGLLFNIDMSHTQSEICFAGFETYCECNLCSDFQPDRKYRVETFGLFFSQPM